MRQPIELEMRGLQTPRERVWASIRKLRTGFTVSTVQDNCTPLAPYKCVDDYFRDLVKAGYIKLVRKGERIKGRTGVVREQCQYDLVKDQFEAPRLKDGVAVTKGDGRLAMWRMMKVLRKGFDFQVLADTASQGDLTVKVTEAKFYIALLVKAGYLKPTKTTSHGRQVYVLVRDTGPHPPAITRVRCVFDRNTGELTPTYSAQEVCDALAE